MSNEVIDGALPIKSYSVTSDRLQEPLDFDNAVAAAAAFHTIPAEDRPAAILTKHGEGIAPGGSGQVIAKTTSIGDSIGKHSAQVDADFDKAYADIQQDKANEADPAALEIKAFDLARIAAARERDTTAARESLGLNENEASPAGLPGVDKTSSAETGKGGPAALSQFAADLATDLDSRMATRQLEELGWRDRDDIDDVMRDMEILAQTDWGTAARLWDKYRPNDIDKPIFIDGDDVDEKKAADKQDDSDPDSPAAKKKAKEQEDKLAAVHKQFLHSDGKFFFRDAEKSLAFEDSGRRLTTEHEDPAVAKSMIDLAEGKGWTSLHLKGSKDFKREVWLQASLRGLDVTGFRPKSEDLARLDAMQKDHLQPGQLNSIEQGREQVKSTPAARAEAVDKESVVDEQQSGLSKKQMQAITALRQVLEKRGDSETVIEKTISVAAERFQNNRVYVGTVLDHGNAPYENNPKNEPSYYIKLNTQQGEKTVWGVDLPRALGESNAKVGEEVALAYQGRQLVTVPVKVYDDQGKLTGTREITTNRNAWDVRRLDTLREEVKEDLAKQLAKGSPQPQVKVYDSNAARSNEPAPRAIEARSNERIRG